MSSQRRDFEKKTKSTMIFIGVFFCIALVISTLLIFADIPMWLNMMIIVILAFVFYLPYMVITAKIKAKKEEKRLKDINKKDIFAD